jgi:hypothetical protein
VLPHNGFSYDELTSLEERGVADNDADGHRMSETRTCLQADRELPQVERVPAHWMLEGHAWVVVLRWLRGASTTMRTEFVPDSLAGSLSGPLGFLACVDYERAPCGPYRELLLIPGLMVFADQRRHFSISRILVSTWESVVNGRANWGIPKDHADIRIEHGTTDRIVVRDGAEQICALQFTPARGPRLPLHTALIPPRYTRLAQLHAGRTYYFQPSAQGAIRACRLLDWQFHPELFPDLRGTRVLLSLRLERFAMTFPVARTA